MSKEKEKDSKQLKDPVELMNAFEDKWKGMTNDQKIETLLGMNMQLAYRLDILAVALTNQQNLTTKDEKEKPNG